MFIVKLYIHTKVSYPYYITQNGSQKDFGAGSVYTVLNRNCKYRSSEGNMYISRCTRDLV